MHTAINLFVGSTNSKSPTPVSQPTSPSLYTIAEQDIRKSENETAVTDITDAVVAGPPHPEEDQDIRAAPTEGTQRGIPH